MVKSDLTSSLFVFGGYIDSRCTNELWTFNTDRNFWKKLNIDPCPSPRANHSASMWISDEGNTETIVIIGGINENLERLNDIWLFSVKELTWTPVMFGTKDIMLPPRSEHTSVICDNDLIVFGGRDSDMRECNDVMVLNLVNRKWRVSTEACLKPTMDKSLCHNAKDITKLRVISKLSDASFGAIANNDQKSSSPNRTISPQRTIDGSPSPIAKHKVKKPPPKLKAADIENALEEMKLLTPTTAAMLHSAVVHVGERSLESYMQTMKKRKRFSGLYNFKLGENDSCIRGRIPCARSGHSANLYGKYMIIFGGDRSQVALNDIYIYTSTDS